MLTDYVNMEQMKNANILENFVCIDMKFCKIICIT